ncbi:MAG: hypothetical protein JXR34_09205 [Bacteroidales bacterium]|nr:hypothetical protein [Bacteroidales bacterium]
MKARFTLVSLAFLLATSLGFSQEEQPKDKPVRDPFASGYLIDAQTSFIPAAKTLEYVIQHRFGTFENGIKDLYGIYAPGSNIRMGLNYVVIPNVQIGWGLNKLNMYNDFNVKWTILEQTRKNTIPIAVTVYGNIAIDGREKKNFGVNYEFTDRLSYFSQLIIGRKIGNRFTVQTGLSFSHFNSVDSLLEHDKIGLHFSGRVKLTPQGSFIFNYDIPLPIKGIAEHSTFTKEPKHNLAFGAEIATSTHSFQIFMGTSTALLPQEIIMNNQNDYTKKGLSFGFVITRLWNF